MSKKVEQSVALSTDSVSGVLVGRFDHALDPKKRLTVPSDWRALMGNADAVYAMPDPVKKCVNLIPKAEMESRLEKLRERSLFDQDCADALEIIGINSELLPFDVQGRVRICDRFLSFANLSGTVAMVGAVRMIRLWNPSVLGPATRVEQSSLAGALKRVAF